MDKTKLTSLKICHEDEDGDNNGKGAVLPTTVVQRWGAQLLSALNYLHESPVLVAHRDINPDNLLVDMALNVRLCDFGLASRLTNDDSGEVAGKNVIQNSVGTVNYSSGGLWDGNACVAKTAAGTGIRFYIFLQTYRRCESGEIYQ